MRKMLRIKKDVPLRRQQPDPEDGDRRDPRRPSFWSNDEWAREPNGKS